MEQTCDVRDVQERARKMARSGRFCTWRLVALELRFVEGVREADDSLFDQSFRQELDTLCREALKAAATWPTAARPSARPSVPVIPRAPTLTSSRPTRHTASTPPKDAPATSATPPLTSAPVPALPMAPAPSAPAKAALAKTAPARDMMTSALAAPPRWVPKYRA